MSTSELSPRPAFQSTEVGNEFEQVPFSRLATLAFFAGLLSLLAAFSTILLPLSMLATALGIAVVWKLSRDKQTGGVWLAQVGLAMAAASIVWSISARAGQEQYMYTAAGEYAKIFLDTLASGKKYEALELKKVESGRQLTGTDLEEYYAQLGQEERQAVSEFLNAPLTKEVIIRGSQADWQFSRGVQVSSSGKQTSVTVEMVDQAAKPPRKLLVRLSRQLGLLTDPDRVNSTALWNCEELIKP